jgi:hypothetical protein
MKFCAASKMPGLDVGSWAGFNLNLPCCFFSSSSSRRRKCSTDGRRMGVGWASDGLRMGFGWASDGARGRSIRRIHRCVCYRRKLSGQAVHVSRIAPVVAAAGCQLEGSRTLKSSGLLMAGSRSSTSASRASGSWPARFAHSISVENGSALDKCVIVDFSGMELRLKLPAGAVIRAWPRPCHWHLTPSGDKWARCGDHALPCFLIAAAEGGPFSSLFAAAPFGGKWARCGDHALPCFQSAAAEARPCLIAPLPAFFRPRPHRRAHRRPRRHPPPRPPARRP